MPGARTAPSGRGAILAAMGRTRAHLVALDPVTDDALEATPGVPVPLPALELPSARRRRLAHAGRARGRLRRRRDRARRLGPRRERPLRRRRAARSDAAAGGRRAHQRARRALSPARLGRPRRARRRPRREGGARARRARPGARGRTYAAWVVPAGSATPQRVGTFIGTRRAVPLDRRVGHGALVAITLEVEPPPERPSRPLRVSAVRP